MAGVWSAVLVLDIRFPSNGPLTPGSGTIYLGGPRLPTELKNANFKGALVFYSSASGLANGVKYWFLGKQIDSFGNEAVRLGSVDTSSNINSVFWTGLTNVGDGFAYMQSPAGTSNRSVRISDGTQPSTEVRSLDGFVRILGHVTNAARPIIIDGKKIQQWSDSIELYMRNTGSLSMFDAANSALSTLRFGNIGTALETITAYKGTLPSVTLGIESENDIRITAGSGNVDFYSAFLGGFKVLSFKGLTGTTPYIKADPLATSLDQWNSSTTSQTIGGVANCTVKLNWRYTPDYILDVRYYVTFPVAPGAAANMSFTLPGSFPTTDLAPLTTRGAYGLCLAQAGGGLANLITRIDPGIIYVFTNGLLNIATWEASITLSIPKP